MSPIFDELLDRMALSFETTFDEYCQAQRDHINEDCLWNHLFRVVVGPFYLPEWCRIFLLLTCRIVTHGTGSLLAQPHGFRGSWSEWYNQLLVRLFPEVYLDTPEANRKANLAGLCSRLLGFCHPDVGLRYGPVPFEAPPGIACLQFIPTGEPNVRSGFQPSLDSSVHSARGEAVQFSTNGVLEYLDGV
jgi:hypothetical protein